MAMSPRLRLGMVGGGQGAFIGAVHRIAARMDDHYELVAGALSADPARARASGAELRLDPARVHDDFRAMAAAEAARPDGIEVVAVVTPNHMHHPVAKAFLDAGIHVVCDKPMTTTIAEAEDLVATVERTGLVFALTHNYSAYPLVRQARAMVEAGELGRIRVVQVEYAQDWLATDLERSGQKQASWRTDPARSGVGGCIGDIGTHAFHLAGFVTGLRAEALCADLSTFVSGRALDDNVHMLLRYDGGARGMLWASQVAAGNESALRLRVYGDKAGLAWNQEHPNHMTFTPLGEPARTIARAGPGTNEAAAHGTRIPPGHPEGYLEGFANLYADAAELIRAHKEAREPAPEARLVPTVRDGLDGIRFVHTAVEANGKGWVSLA